MGFGYDVFGSQAVAAVQHKGVLVCFVQYGVNVETVFHVFLYFAFIGINFSCLEFEVTLQRYGAFVILYAELGGTQRIFQCICQVEGTDKQVSGGNIHLHHGSETSGVASGQFQSVAAVAVGNLLRRIAGAVVCHAGKFVAGVAAGPLRYA